MSQQYSSPDAHKFVSLISSEEPLLLREYMDATRKSYRDAGFEEIQSHYIENNFDWESVMYSNNMSLFSTQTLKIFQFYEAKPGIAGSKAMIEIGQNATLEEPVIFVMPKLDGRAKNSAWCKAIKKIGHLIELKPIYTNQFVPWLQNRAKSKGLNIEFDAIQYLADRTEGHLLAADQELEKLALVCVDQVSINLAQMQSNVGNQAKYASYELIDYCLKGNQNKSLRILANLKAEGVYPLIILSVVRSGLEILSQIKQFQQNPQKLNQIYQQNRIWDSKKQLYLAAAKRLNLDQIEHLIRQSSKIERLDKGQQKDFPSHIKLKPNSTNTSDRELIELVTNFSGISQ